MIAVETFLFGIGRASLQAGVLVLFVLLAQWFFKKHLSPKWRCALWMLPALRLLLPISISSATSVFNLMPSWEQQSQNSPPSAPQRLSAIAPSPSRPAANGADFPESSTIVPPAINASDELKGSQTADRPIPTANPPVTDSPSIVAPEVAASEPAYRWGLILFIAWLAGVVLLAIKILLNCRSLDRQFGRSEPITHESTLALFDGCRDELGVKTQLSLVENDQLNSPVLHGCIRPRLVLPKGLAEQLGWDELRFVFLHELAHVKRRDVLQNWFATVLQVIHWFNPLVWVGFARWRADRELACDALALETAGVERKQEYGRTILRLLESSPRVLGTPAMVGILEDKRQLRERISMIASFVPAKRWSILALSLLATLAVVGLTDARLATEELAKAASSTADEATPPILEQPKTETAAVTNGPAMKITVFDQSGNPVEGAQVRAPSAAAFFGGFAPSPTWQTDRSGQATIRLGEPPSAKTRQNTWFTMSIQHPDFAPRGLSWSSESGDARTTMPQEITVKLEKGIRVGGVVRDERGNPLRNVRIGISGTGYSYQNAQNRHQEYPQYWSDARYQPAAISDANGVWSASNVPPGLENLTIQFMRPDGSTYSFATFTPENPLNHPTGETADIGKLRDGSERFVLKDGATFRGLVVDPSGNPVPNVLIKEIHNRYQPGSGLQFRADGNGRFTLRNRQRQQLLLIAMPENFAIQPMVVTAQPQGTDVTFRLVKVQPLNIKVVNDVGQPIPGASVRVDTYRSKNLPIDLLFRTAQDGTMVWTNAPTSGLVLAATAPDTGVQRNVHVPETTRELVIQLRPGMDKEIIISGKSVDAETGADVKLTSIRFLTGDFGPQPEPQPINSSSFRLPLSAERFMRGMYPTYKMQCEAEGYINFTTQARDFAEGDWELVIKMNRGKKPGGTILSPDGDPVSSAEVTVVTGETGFLFMNSPGKVSGQERTLRVASDGNGQFEFQDPGINSLVLITHEDGFLETSVDTLRSNPKLSLLPWGSIEGVLKIGGKGIPRANVNLSGQVYRARGGWNSIFSAETDSDGIFRFDKIPPGDYILYRYFDRAPGPITETYQMPVTVKPGETAQITYGGNGRTVIGQVEGNADWKNDVHLLVLKQPPGPKPPRHDDYLDTEEFQKAFADYQNNQQLERRRAERSYWVNFNQDGSFRIDDVPPGNYELRINVTEALKPGENRWGPVPPDKVLASLTREVIVPQPASGQPDQPLDLGLLELSWKGPQQTVPAISMVTQTLDGKSFSLETLRGKFVLLNFWSTWSKASQQQMQFVDDLRSKFKTNNHVVFIDVNLGEDSSRVRQGIKQNQSSAEQLILTGPALAAITEQLSVESLPAAFLLNPKGRVIGRDLNDSSLERAVESALNRYSTANKE